MDLSPTVKRHMRRHRNLLTHAECIAALHAHAHAQTPFHIKYSVYKRMRKLSRNKGIIIQGQRTFRCTKLSSEWQHHTQPASAIPHGAQAPEATQPFRKKKKSQAYYRLASLHLQPGFTSTSTGPLCIFIKVIIRGKEKEKNAKAKSTLRYDGPHPAY